MTTTRRGTLLSFDPATWTAMVLLDGADAEALVPVGQWISPGLMAANAEVAVILFDPTNTDDGLVLGPYGALGAQDLGATSTPTFAALNLGSAAGATGGSLNASGTLTTAAAGSAIFAGYSSYVADGLFGATALPLKIFNPGVGEIRLGYSDNGAGSYTPRIGFYSTAIAGQVAVKASIGPEVGTGDFTIRSGAANAEHLRIPYAGASLLLAATQLLTTRRTGWGTPTGTLYRTALTNASTQAQFNQALMALITDLITHGLIGA